MHFVRNNKEVKDDTYVVGIGASAGGLEAINELFDHITSPEHVAFIVVQHLSSDYKSLLVELLAKHTTMPVQEARHRTRVEAGKVYVIPNNRELSIQDGMLMLAQKEFDKGPNTAIDTFFQSLAEDQRDYAIAVLLSGTGTDGTRGIHAIKNYGGFVIVQDPETAKFDGMPKNAIASGYVDLIVPPHEVPNQIDNYIDGVLPPRQAQSRKNFEDIQDVLSMVFRKTGYDFSQYKHPTVIRRIARRMQMTKKESLRDYGEFVRSDTEEAAHLAKEFFYGVTNFFRDKDAFSSLDQEVIQKLVREKDEHEIIKVWVTACSTGQEAYSIAILIDKALQQVNKRLEVKIFASDIDKASIECAAKGRYTPNQLLGVDRHVLNDYFTDTEEGTVIIPRIRKQIVFATHDILKDPPFIKNDLVTCRNLLIYLNPSLQEAVLATLNFALNTGGYLFLGTSENPSPLKRGFTEVDSKWKIYQKSSLQTAFTRKASSPVRGRSPVAQVITPAKPKIDAQLAEDFREVLADKMGYAALYLNESYEIKEGIGNLKKYISIPDKFSSLNILKMTPPEISGALGGALRKCIKENKEQILRQLKLKKEEETRLVDMFIYPPSGSGFALLVFADSAADPMVQEVNEEPGEEHKDYYVRQLEEELRETRTSLQMDVEGLETANEELQSSNEELQSANEELQSSNEELQSLNEELHTLNTEHQMRIRELVELNDDITNYLQTFSQIGQVFLDHKLRIRRFNKAATNVLNIIDSDIGRSFEHITHRIRSGRLMDEISTTNRKGKESELEIELDDNKVFLVRIIPYIRQDKVQDGLVVTMVDITTTRNLNTLIKSVFDASANPIFVFEAVYSRNGKISDYKCKIANYTALRAFGKNEESADYLLKKDFPKLASVPLLRKYTEVIETGNQESTELNFIVDDREYWYQMSINRTNAGMVLVLSDVTQRKVDEEKLKKSFDELVLAKDSLRDLNARLEDKVKERTLELETSEERFRIVASHTNDVIWDWNLASDELWWSEGYYQAFDFDRSSAEVKRHSFRMRQVHPDDRRLVESEMSKVLQDGGYELNIAYRFRRNDGTYAHVLDRGTLLKDELGIPYRMIGAMVDVTKLEQSSQELQQKNSELQLLIQEFRFVTDFMPHKIVWSAKPDGRLDFFNQQWFRYSGMDKGASNEKGWIFLIHPEDRSRAIGAWEQSLQTGEPFVIELRMRKADGSYRWFLARALALKGEENRIAKWFGTFTDIHDHKLAEKLLEEKIEERTHELKLLNARLEASNTDLMQFASVASHDLKEPLRKIQFFSGLLKERYKDDLKTEVSAYIDRIAKASSRATNLINDVLSYSRLSSENLFVEVDLNNVLSEILQDLELVIQEKKARIIIGDLPSIEAVQGQMRQLFQNLIANSIKFNKPGQASTINISSRKVEQKLYPEVRDEGDGIYEIRIRDNGIGFDEIYAKKIFSLFQRLNSREHYEGTGIGLSIAQKIVERHHGIIHARGKVDEGAEFIIVLPSRQNKFSANGIDNPDKHLLMVKPNIKE